MKFPKFVKKRVTLEKKHITGQNLHPGSVENFLIYYGLFLRTFYKGFTIADHYISFIRKKDGFVRFTNIKYIQMKENINTEIRNLIYMTHAKSKYLLIPIYIINSNNTCSHANIIIYNRLTQEAEIIEPIGSGDDVYKKITPKELFADVERKFNIRIKKFHDVYQSCPLYGSQYYNNETKMQSLQTSFMNNMLGINGYCVAWCFFFALLRFINPSIDLINLQTIFLNSFAEKAGKIIRKFHLEFIKFRYEIQSKNDVLNIARPVGIPYELKLSCCKMSKYNGGYDLNVLKTIGKSHGINGNSRTNICNQLLQIKNISYNFINSTKYNQIKNNTSKNRNMKKVLEFCSKPTSKGGIDVKMLRRFAESFGMNTAKKTRAEICEFLKKL